MSLPIMNGREIIGHAATVAGAARKLRKILDLHPRAKLAVWERTPLQQELNDLPPAFVYSVRFGQ